MLTRPLGIQGHRGARALFPENTLEGFIAASALGVMVFELDVGLTVDNVVVVSHDPALNPDITRGSSGVWLDKPGPTIRSITYAELSGYDVGRIRPGSSTSRRFPQQVAHDGARIPTLAAVLAALPQTCFTIEIKTDPAHPNLTASPPTLTEAVVAIVDTANAAERVILESFDWRVQRHLRRIRPDIRLAWLTSADTLRDAALWWPGVAVDKTVVGCVAAEGGGIWAPDYRDLTKAQIQQAHALGMLVLPWTVNQPADISRLISWGVDGLISDRPDLALRLDSRHKTGH